MSPANGLPLGSTLCDQSALQKDVRALGAWRCHDLPRWLHGSSEDQLSFKPESAALSGSA